MTSVGISRTDALKLLSERRFVLWLKQFITQIVGNNNRYIKMCLDTHLVDYYDIVRLMRLGRVDPQVLFKYNLDHDYVIKLVPALHKIYKSGVDLSVDAKFKEWAEAKILAFYNEIVVPISNGRDCNGTLFNEMAKAIGYFEGTPYSYFRKFNDIAPLDVKIGNPRFKCLIEPLKKIYNQLPQEEEEKKVDTIASVTSEAILVRSFPTEKSSKIESDNFEDKVFQCLSHFLKKGKKAISSTVLADLLKVDKREFEEWANKSDILTIRDSKSKENVIYYGLKKLTHGIPGSIIDSPSFPHRVIEYFEREHLNGYPFLFDRPILAHSNIGGNLTKIIEYDYLGVTFREFDVFASRMPCVVKRVYISGKFIYFRPDAYGIDTIFRLCDFIESNGLQAHSDLVCDRFKFPLGTYTNWLKAIKDLSLFYVIWHLNKETTSLYANFKFQPIYENFYKKIIQEPQEDNMSEKEEKTETSDASEPQGVSQINIDDPKFETAVVQLLTTGTLWRSSEAISASGSWEKDKVEAKLDKNTLFIKKPSKEAGKVFYSLLSRFTEKTAIVVEPTDTKEIIEKKEDVKDEKKAFSSPSSQELISFAMIRRLGDELVRVMNFYGNKLAIHHEEPFSHFTKAQKHLMSGIALLQKELKIKDAQLPKSDDI